MPFFFFSISNDFTDPQPELKNHTASFSCFIFLHARDVIFARNLKKERKRWNVEVEVEARRRHFPDSLDLLFFSLLKVFFLSFLIVERV